MDLWFEWREENNDERFSFEDSDRFEEDSLADSWQSEPESICANWRGWKRSSQSGASFSLENDEKVDSLLELCAKTVAKYIPFEAVEQTYPQIPEQIQLRIAFWSFPQIEDDIRLYSCLANGSPDEFQRGEHLVKAKAVRDALQIGFHLSATVNQQHSSVQTKGTFNVAVTFDRGHITSCNCTCYPSATWCAHIIALCLIRIHHPDQVCLRAPVSEYLSRLRRDQLQKFAQYLISELPQQILPTAQRLLDELLSSQESAINTLSGAPDPTAGPAATDHNKWCLDEKALKENVRKMLIRFCGPVPLVFSDVSAVYMSTTAPPTAAEWSNLLRPLKGREPEGMWNLLYIVRELFHRRDNNSISLLSTLTEECLANDQVVVWWFDSRSQASGTSVHRNHGNGYRNNTNAASTEATKHACAGFCDELVVLWRLAALNPKLNDEDRKDLKIWLEQWHQDAVDKAKAGHGGGFQAAVSCFPGFHPAIEACSLTWGNVNISSDSENIKELCDINGLQESSVSRSKYKANDFTCEEVAGISKSETNTGLEYNQEKLPKQDMPIPLHEIEEDLEVLCARAEALHVHGYSAKASKLAIRLAEQILDNPTHLDISIAKTANKSTKSFSSSTLVKAAFLCGVLAEDPHCHHLAFKVGIFGLEIPRQPAKSKALEVKLAHQETELVALLRRLPLHGEEMMVVREKANLICQGKLQRGGAILPIMLATFLFEVLCCPGSSKKESDNEQEKKVDEDIGFMAAFCALGMRSNILETHYPILCEGIRRQRGDLAIALLDYCKDNSCRLKAIKDVLLDKSRYEGPSFASEAERQSNTRQNENDKKKSEDCNGGVKMRGGFGLPNRRGSNSQSSSNTSDSGTDSGSRESSGHNRPRGRGNGNKTQSKITVTVNEIRREEESASSSGVDTDSAINRPSPGVTAKVVSVCRGGPRNVISPVRGSAQAAVNQRDGRLDGAHGRSCDGAQDCENRNRKQKPSPRRGNQQCDNRATSDLEGSEFEDDDPESPNESRDVVFSPSNNTNMKLVQEIPLPLNRGKTGKDVRKDYGSWTSANIDAGIQNDDDSDSISESSSPINLSPLTSSSSEGPSSFNAAKSKSSGLQRKAKCRTSNTCAKFKEVNSERASDSDVKASTPTGIPGSSGFMAVGGNTTSHLEQSRASKDFDSRTTELESLDEGLEFESQCETADQGAPSNSENDLPMTSFSGNSPVPTVGLNVELIPAAVSPLDGVESVVPETGTEVEVEVEVPDQRAPSARVEIADVALLQEVGVARAAAVEREIAQAGAVADPENTDTSPRGSRKSNRKNRRKRKGKNSAVNQATEAEAHFMFELAKTVLTRAGGNINTSVFSQPTSNTSHVGPHRGLQLCAFEIGLFALGLHNRTSVNWLSRTYSPHVSWISGQAMEIGSTAIQLLIERWESNLTPSEVASIAERASKSNDPTMVRAAAELGLSCLHMAHTLNPGEIQKALLQCRDENTQLLDRACQAVEIAARGGGIYPEVLFGVARHWHYLHEQNQTNISRSHKDNSRNPRSQASRTQQQQPATSPSPSVSPYLHPLPMGPHSVPPPPYQTAEQYVQSQMHQQVQHIMNQGPYNSCASYRSCNQLINYGLSRQPHAAQYQISSNYGGLPPPYQTSHPAVCQLSSTALKNLQGGQVSYYLNNAYRVGMLALESLARRTPDDRPNVKYSRNPACSDDIRWLCSLSARLGTTYLHRFCVSALNAVVSPFVLHELALEAARHLARSNPGQLAVNLRSPNISPLVQKSLSMYGQCIHHHLMVMAQSDHEDFVELLRQARQAFCMVPGGMSQFNELLQSIRKLYPKKKDLWQKIMTGLAKA